MCGGHPSELPVIRHKDNWFSCDGISSIENIKDELLLLDSSIIRWINRDNRDIDFKDNIIIGKFSGYPGILQTGSHRRRPYFWPRRNEKHRSRTMTSLVIESLSKEWGINEEEIYDSSLVGQDREERIIGEENNSPVTRRVGVLKKPE
jgi:hypothetical protein